jgi:hypothetical protein
MSITIKFGNPNTTFDEIQIFRSDTKLAVGEIPTNKIATITDGSLQYEDTTALQNKYYYYVVGVKKGTEVVYSPQSVAINMPYTGPGPTTLQSGTWERGYFGLCTAAEVALTQEVRDVVGVGTINNTNDVWAKWILKGKILFVPIRHILTGVSWNQIYSAGCMYGVAGNGPATGHGLTGADQLKILSKGEHDYIIRTPRCQTSVDYSYNTGVTKDYDSEWFHLFTSLYNQGQPFPCNDVASFDASTYFVQASAPNTFFAEFTGANAACQYAQTPGQIFAPGGTSPRATLLYWRPILELVL